MPFFDNYPYTNLQNVNLDWVLARVKEWGQMVEDNNTRFENLQQANEDFKTYVTTYLQNLDVQDEINIKLDSMLESGVLVEYMQPYISTGVTTWLDEHITEPIGVVIDTSLTVAGACADSKAVGDKLNELNNSVAHIFNEEARVALLNCFRHVAWIDNNANYFTTLKNALEPVTYPNIVAVFSPDTTIYTNTPIESLKQYLTVTYYDTAQSAGIEVADSNYTLSGSLSDGENIILVIYGSLTTTFLVTASESHNQYIWQWSASGGTSLVKQDGHASISSGSPNNIAINKNLSNSRRTFAVETGISSIYQYYTTGGVALGVYPIPVPEDATGASAVIVPSERVIYGRIVKFNNSTSKYTDITGQVWQNGTAQWSFSADNNLYMLLASAFDSQDSIYSPEPVSVTLTFTR